jgi:hypothetical protein
LLKRGIIEAKKKPSAQNNQAIIKMLSTLAAHYISEGIKTSSEDCRRSNELLEEATEIINEAEKSSHSSLDMSLRKGNQNHISTQFLVVFLQVFYCWPKMSLSLLVSNSSIAWIVKVIVFQLYWVKPASFS